MGSDAMKGAGPRSYVDLQADSWSVRVSTAKEAPMSEQYEGRQFVGIDLHRRRSVIVRTTEGGDVLWSAALFPDTC